MEEIKVHVCKYPDRDNLVLRYLCPLTGKHQTKSAGTANMKAALTEAGKWEAELREGRYQKPSKMSWADFIKYHSEHRLMDMRERTAAAYDTTLKVFAKVCRPRLLSEVTTAKVTAFKTELRRRKLAPSTIAKHLRHLSAVLRWACHEELLRTMPKFPVPKRGESGKRMKGRPITTEEFERMLQAVPDVVDADKVDAWKFYLRGLWLSGLRLGESLGLSWEPCADRIAVDFSGKHPMLDIPAAAEKGKKDRRLPMAPEFAELLESVPESERRGRVFKLGVQMEWVSATITAIGKEALVKVVDAGGKVKYASAHDLRRAFGTRWSRKLSPARLMVLMRHEDIQTTMKFYVNERADELAAALWETLEEPKAELGNNSGNTAEKSELGN